MKRLVSGLAMSTVAIFLLFSTSSAEKVPLDEIVLFGAKLDNATSESFRAACSNAGLYHLASLPGCFGAATIDTYRVTDQIEGARVFNVMYANSTGRLIRVEYKFGNKMSFIELVNIVASKYGPPDSDDANRVRPALAWSGWSDESTEWRISVHRAEKDQPLTLSYYNNQAWGACLIDGLGRESPEQVSKRSDNAF
jgi:hypothetical protein